MADLRTSGNGALGALAVNKLSPSRACEGKSSEKRLKAGRTPDFNQKKKKAKGRRESFTVYAYIKSPRCTLTIYYSCLSIMPQ